MRSRKDYYSNSKDYINRWVISYADFVTMLLALFIVMFAMSSNVTKYQANATEKMSLKNSQNIVKTQVTDVEKIENAINQNISQSNLIKLIEDPRGLIIRMSNTVLFDKGSAEIKPEAYDTLNNISKVLSDFDNPCIIEGHTDSMPIHNEKYPSNWELSTTRATNIISYMIKEGNISPKRLSAVGYGEYMPIADNTSNSGRILNRRVDIIVLDKE